MTPIRKAFYVFLVITLLFISACLVNINLQLDQIHKSLILTSGIRVDPGKDPGW